MLDGSRSKSQELNGRRRLLVISPGGLGLHYHGPAISIYRMLLHLTDKFSVDVVHGVQEQGDIEPLQGRAFRTGTKRDSLFGSLSFALAASRFVLRNHKRYDAVILSSLSVLTLIPGVLGRLLGSRVIGRAAAIAEISTETGGSLGRKLKTAMIRRLSAYLAISDRIASKLTEMVDDAERVHHIPNSVDIQRFTPVDAVRSCEISEELGLARAPRLRLVCVGSVTERKGQHLIIEALKLLPDDIVLLMVGPYRDDAFKRQVNGLLKNSGTAIRVDHIPFMQDIERAYATGQIFLLPSTGEGMPNGMLEAMSSGLVPLGTRVSGIEDLVGEGCGRFVERDARSIANAIQHYIDNPDALQRESIQARAKIVDYYSTQAIAGHFAALISGGQKIDT